MMNIDLIEFVLKSCRKLSIFFRPSSSALATVLASDAKDGQNGTILHRLGHRLTTWRALYYLHILGFALRAFLLSYVLLLHPQMYETLSHYDPTMITIHREYINDSLFGLCMAPLCTLPVYYDYLVYVKPNRLIWRVILKPLIWENRQNFFKLNPSLALQFNRSNLFKWAYGLLMWPIKMWRCMDAQFERRLTHFANVDSQIRVRALLFTFLLELADVGIQVGYAFGLTILFVYTQWLVYRNYNNWLTFCLVALDMLGVLYAVLKTLKLIAFLVQCIMLACFVHGAHLGKLNHQLAGLLLHCRTRAKYKLSPVVVSAKLSHYRTEHIQMLNDFIIANRDFAAGIMLPTYCSAVIASVYLLTVLFIMDLVPIVKINALLLLLAMLLFGLGVASPMIHATNTLYAADKDHFAFVGYFGRHSIVQKIKQQNFYELLNTESKVCFTVGHYFKVTNEAFFQFLLFYSGYVMYSFKMFIKHRTYIPWNEME